MSPDEHDDEEARRRRAESLRDEIEEVLKGGPAARPPRNPRDFVEERMREREHKAKESAEGDPEAAEGEAGERGDQDD